MNFLLPLFLTVGGLVAYFFVAIRFALYQDLPWAFVAVSAAGVALAVRTLVSRRSVVSAGLAVVCASVFSVGLWYLAVGSHLPERETKPAVGDPFPAFRLKDSTDEWHVFRAPRERAALILFYRGDW